MWRGNNPTRANLTGQPRGGYAMTDREAVGVMDELVMSRDSLTAAGQAIADAWENQTATIRDYAHCGGRDARMHITVVDNNTGRAYHVPVISEVEGNWNYDVYSNVTG